jgi:hypothetical protein
VRKAKALDVRDGSEAQAVNLAELVQTLSCLAEAEGMGCRAQAHVYEEDGLELEEDVGVSRLLLFQAALKERRTLETEG